MADDIGDNIHEKSDEWKIEATSQSADNAINRIVEIANALLNTVKFSEGMQEGFQQLATSLVELETGRRRLHEELEVQTIKASLKRHALNTRPAVYQRELEEAVLAARTSNVMMIQSLQLQMAVASEETEKALKKQEYLQLANSKYIPERDVVTKQHDEIIAALNQKMSDKASKRIKLNETRDHLRDTLLATEEYDLGMRNLKEDMEIFRAEYEANEKQLQKDMAQTQDGILKKRQMNADEKRLTDELLDKIVNMDGTLSVILKDVCRTENSKARLQMQRIHLEETIVRERLLNQQASGEVVILQAAKDKKRMEYENILQELKEKIIQVDVQFVGVTRRHQGLITEKDANFLIREEAVIKKSKAQASVRKFAMEVQVMKNRTTALIEKAADLVQENTQRREDLRTLGVNHSATVDTFSQQIQEYQASLDIETTEKLKAQEEHEEMEKVLNDFKIEQIRFMNDMTKKIEEGRRQHKILVKQSSEFHQSVANNKKLAQSLEAELEMMEREMDMMKKKVEMEVERLKTSIELYKTENKKWEQCFEEKKPVLEKLEADYEETSQEYSRFKTKVVTVRNKQKSVQEQIDRTQAMLDSLAIPQSQHREDIKKCHINSLEHLRQSALERKNQETEIYDRVQKLESIVAENQRFEKSCLTMSEIISDMCTDINAHGYYQEFLVIKLRELEERFMIAWDICVTMEEESAEQDRQILKGIEELKQETKDRCIVLTGISDQLNSEMERLTGFFENVNSRRSQDRGQEMRKSLWPTPHPVLPSSPARSRKGSSLFGSQGSITLPTTSSQTMHRGSISQPAKA